MWPFAKKSQATVHTQREQPRCDKVLTNWEIGWKVANLSYDTTHHVPVFFQVVTDGVISGAYRASDESECCQYAHYTPYPACRCGFNAFDQRVDALNYLHQTKMRPHSSSLYCRQSLGLIRVGLKGRVIAGTYSATDERWGYRAQTQQVTDVFLPSHCWSCSDPATHLRLWRHYDNPRSAYGPQRFVISACTQHAGDERLTIDQYRQAARSVGVAVRWDTE